jgi:integrase
MAQSSVNIQHHNDILIDLEKKIELLTKGSSSYYRSLFKNLSIKNRDNAKTLYDFLETEHNLQNVKLSTILTHIKAICLFNEYLSYKDFEKIAKEDIIYYLNSLRKKESDDQTHKWIGTYNTRQMVLSKFFRWFYNRDQNNESDHDKCITPACMQGIKQLLRKETSPYKPSDIWTNEDQALFLKYCPEKRDKCYHAMANDTSCRPHELLSLKLKDIKFKVSSTGLQYAEVHIVESKTKPRTLPLIFSIPYVKDWIDSHPMANNPNAFLFISLADSNFGQQLSENALYKQYTRSYKKCYFPKLLKDSSIPEADKSYIRNLLTKPWTPYIQRHSALTSKSLILKEHTLRDHAGWSMSSRMPQVYIHYFGNESSKSLLEAYGIENYREKQTNILKSKTCPNCQEPNKPDSKFCIKCKMVLSYDSYTETLEKQKQKEERLELIERQVSLLMESQKDMQELLKHPEKLLKL